MRKLLSSQKGLLYNIRYDTQITFVLNKDDVQDYKSYKQSNDRNFPEAIDLHAFSDSCELLLFDQEGYPVLRE